MTDCIHLRCLNHDPAIKSQVLTKESRKDDVIEMLGKREEIIALDAALEKMEIASISLPEPQFRTFEFIAQHPKCTLSIWKGDHQITGAYTPKAGM